MGSSIHGVGIDEQLPPYTMCVELSTVHQLADTVGRDGELPRGVGDREELGWTHGTPLVLNILHNTPCERGYCVYMSS
ncbi:hypothetical protein GCM10027436_26620 [Actinophytocola sediminis]